MHAACLPTASTDAGRARFDEAPCAALIAALASAAMCAYLVWRRSRERARLQQAQNTPESSWHQSAASREPLCAGKAAGALPLFRLSLVLCTFA